MKPIISILLVLPFIVSTQAALITGNVKDTSLAPAETNITFTPLSTPMASAPSVIFSTVKSVITDTNGDFALSLAPGNYKVSIGTNANDSFLISVPLGAGPHVWTDLATGTLTYQYPFSPAYVDRIIATARGDLFAFDGTNVIRLPVGSASQVLSSDPATAAGLKWARVSDLFAPPWVQAVAGEYATYTASSTIIPADDSLPQSSEGIQTATVTITPQCATNYLYVYYAGMASASSSLLTTVALFRDAESSAIAVNGDTIYSTHARLLSLAARIPCQTTNAQMFKIRVGPANAGTLYLNGNSSGRLYGGLASHKLIIYEAQ